MKHQMLRQQDSPGGNEKLVLRIVLAIIVALMLLLASQQSRGGTDTYTGAELLGLATFPTTAPTLNGSSIVFGMGTTPWDKLFVLPLIPAGTVPPSAGAVDIQVIFNLTRLTDDWDPIIALGDGVRIVGGQAADNGGGRGFAEELNDLGTAGNRTRHDQLFDAAGYPTIGNSIDVTVDFSLAVAATEVDLAFGTGTGGFTSTSPIDRGSAVNLIFLRDNDLGEQYQVNSVTVTTPFPRPLAIDIKPGSAANPINPRSHGVIPVAVLTEDDFDAQDIDPSTLQFGPGGAAIAHAQAHPQDVDGDGDIDLVAHFRTADTGIQCGDVEATVTGETFDGIPLAGTDVIRTLGCNRGPK